MMHALDRYFDAWNTHDPGQVVAALTDDGTCEDPTAGGPLNGGALAATPRFLNGVFHPSVGSTDLSTLERQWL